MNHRKVGIFKFCESQFLNFKGFWPEFFNNYRNVFCHILTSSTRNLLRFLPKFSLKFRWKRLKNMIFCRYFCDIPCDITNGQKNVRYFFAIAIWKKIHAIHFFISCITSHQHWTLDAAQKSGGSEFAMSQCHVFDFEVRTMNDDQFIDWKFILFRSWFYFELGFILKLILFRSTIMRI